MSSCPGKSAKRIFALDVPGIHVLPCLRHIQDVDGRGRPTGVRHDSCFMRPCPWRGWPEHLDAAALRVLLLARSRGWAVAALALAWSGEAQQSIGGASSLSG